MHACRPAELPSGGGLGPNGAPNESRFWGQKGPENEPKQAKIAQTCLVHLSEEARVIFGQTHVWAQLSCGSTTLTLGSQADALHMVQLR